jgi:hypothetical protein
MLILAGLFTVAMIFLPGIRPLLFALAALSVGLAMYAAPLENPGPYWLIVVATATITAGVLLVFSVTLFARALELILYLWALAFPIGAAIGLYAWTRLDPELDLARNLELSRAVMTCIRFGLGLFWVMLAWAYLVLNVPQTNGEQLAVQDALVIAALVPILLLFWIAGRNAAWDGAKAYGEWLQARQLNRRRELATPFHTLAMQRLSQYAAIDGETDAEVRRTKRPQDALVVPQYFDTELNIRLNDIARADWDASLAAVSESWTVEKFHVRFIELQEKIEALKKDTRFDVHAPIAPVSPTVGSRLLNRWRLLWTLPSSASMLLRLRSLRWPWHRAAPVPTAEHSVTEVIDGN